MEPAKRVVPIIVALGLISCGGGSDSSSGGGTIGAEAGCYFVPEGDVSFAWTGGAGPTIIEVYDNATCTAPVSGVMELVAVAATASQAAARCGEGSSPEPFETEPAVEPPNSFFECD